MIFPPRLEFCWSTSTAYFTSGFCQDVCALVIITPLPLRAQTERRFQEEIQRLKDQLAGQGGVVDGDGEPGQVGKEAFLSHCLSTLAFPFAGADRPFRLPDQCTELVASKAKTIARTSPTAPREPETMNVFLDSIRLRFRYCKVSMAHSGLSDVRLDAANGAAKQRTL